MTTHADTLETSFGAHGVRVTFQRAYKGPSVTLYAYQLEPGQSVKSVTAVAADLAVAVGQEAVRILAPIPGTSLIGIEVPNAVRCTADYEPETSDWAGVGILPIPIGVDVKSEVIEADLTSLPHLLIAGATGSGKSVALNTIITALIARNTPSTLRLHLIDPKRVELAQFADAPQVENVVTNLDETSALLEDIVGLMEYRYTLFEESGVRNIAEYNAVTENDCRDIRANDGHSARFMPYHVVVVDEMADLMMQRKKEVEPLIVRIAQLARAAGIHLILATQRPTVDVITGLIKANVPSRLAFTVASVKDSMVILDQTGANALAGKGDALFLPIGQNRPTRVQGLWTSDERIGVVIDHAVGSFERPVQQTSGVQAHDDEGEILTPLPGGLVIAGVPQPPTAHTFRLTNAYDPGEGDLAERFANQNETRNAAYEELIEEFPTPFCDLPDIIGTLDEAAKDFADASSGPWVPRAHKDPADGSERPRECSVDTEQQTDRRGVAVACFALGLGIGSGLSLVNLLAGLVF